MSKRRHNFGTKRFKEKSLFIFHARIALKSLILLFVRLIARGARIGKTHTHTQTDRQTDRQNEYCNPRACAPRVNEKNTETRIISYFLEMEFCKNPASIHNLHGNSLNIFLIRIVVPSPNSKCPLPDVNSKFERHIQDEV